MVVRSIAHKAPFKVVISKICFIVSWFFSVLCQQPCCFQGFQQVLKQVGKTEKKVADTGQLLLKCCRRVIGVKVDQ